MSNCDQSCRTRKGLCACGALKDGVLQDGHSLQVSLMITDGSVMPGERKVLAMMTDSEIRDMRASVRGMPVSRAMLLPIYDEFRGLLDDGGQPMARARAFIDGAVYDRSSIEPTEENIRALGDVLAARQMMVADLRSAHRQPINDNEPTHARRGGA